MDQISRGAPDAHRLRAEVDAVIVGACTVRADDPRLTVCLDSGASRGRPQPIPVIATGRAGLPARAWVFGRHPNRHRLPALTVAPEPCPPLGLSITMAA